MHLIKDENGNLIPHGNEYIHKHSHDHTHADELAQAIKLMQHA